MKRISLLIVVLFCLSCFPATTFPAEQRPKIAVVLSGGGARGFAHVGVLRWFEEHHIPVDMVAGTSMGGLVGGMYATGMSPDELASMVDRIDWYDLFRPLPRYDTLSFRRKEDRKTFPNSFELGLRGGFKFPPGVNPGHSIGLLLDRYTVAYPDDQNFDELPIPFRCIATDMVDAKQVILSKGSLSNALRATMAIPGVFYPVEIEGKTLTSDGGLLNNVPTDVAETMGADVIIAVDIGTPLLKRDELDTMGGILSQTISVAMDQNIKKNLDKTLHPKLKVVIAPDLKKYTTFSFADYKHIEDIGYEGAQQLADQLMPYAVTDEEWTRYLQDRESRIKRAADVHVPQAIKVEGTGESAGKAIEGALRTHVGVPIDADSLDKDLSRIWGRGRYAGLGYEMTQTGGQDVLLIRAREKGYAPPFLNLGLEINNTQTDVFDFNLRAQVTFLDLKSQGSEWRLRGAIGSETSLGFEYYKLLGQTRFFLSPSGYFQQTKTGIFREERQLGEYSIKTSQIGADLGYNFDASNEMRFGYFLGHREGKVRIGNPELPEGGGKFHFVSLRWSHDSTDSAVLPDRGVRAYSELEYDLDSPVLFPGQPDESFFQASSRVTVFLNASKKNIILLSGEGDTSFDKNAPVISKFRLGGLLRVSAASRNEFIGNHLFYGGIGYLRTIATLPYLIGEKVSVGGFYEFGAAYDKWENTDTHQSISVVGIAETFVGPIFVGGSFGDGGRNNFFFALGRVF